MSLTKRQIEILLLLKNQSDWITSEKLSHILGANKKSIQADINSLIHESNTNINLVVNQRNGYFLKGINQHYSKSLAKYISENEVYSNMNYRASLICTYLCFQTDFVSMQSLSETFYLSKSSVSESIKNIQRWIDRINNMELVISRRFGVRIVAPENNILIFLSVITTKQIMIQSSLPTATISLFMDYCDTVSSALIKSLLLHTFTIEGNSFKSLVRLISFMLLRSQLGFKIDYNKQEPDKSPIIETLYEELVKNYKITLTTDQFKLINERFSEFASLRINHKCDSQYSTNVQDFESKIIKFLNLPSNYIFKKDGYFYSHMERMMNRIKLGHSVMNNNAHTSISSYPLESYLIGKFIQASFGIQPSLSETGYIVDYLAEALEKFKERITICLVSDESLISIRNLRKDLNSNLNNKISKFDLLPRYIFDNIAPIKYQYDIYLTTDVDLAFSENNFFFIDIAKGTQKYYDTITNFKKYVKKIKKQKQEKLIAKFFTNKNNVKIRKKSKILINYYPLIVDSDFQWMENHIFILIFQQIFQQRLFVIHYQII